MVIFAIGGVIVGGVIGAATYDDYSCHSDYSDYSDYSDAAERERIKRAAEIERLETQKQNKLNALKSYKQNHINSYIEGSQLRNKPADQITDSDLNIINSYAISSISRDENLEKRERTAKIRKEIKAVESAIRELEDVMKKMEGSSIESD